MHPLRMSPGLLAPPFASLPNTRADLQAGATTIGVSLTTEERISLNPGTPSLPGNP